MTIKEKREYINRMLTDSINLGIQLANRSLQPLGDKLKKKEIKEWTSLMGIKPEKIDALLKNKLIKEYSVTKSTNAAKYYSKTEISAALLKENILTGYGGRYEELALI